MRVLVLHGPNLDRLGARAPELYGGETLERVNARIRDAAASLGVVVECVQSAHEGELVSQVHRAAAFDGLVVNPGGYAHTSVAIRDAIESLEIPVIEVHLSNIHARESFRRRSVTASACGGQIAGLGVRSYTAALYALSSAAVSPGSGS